MNINTHDIHRRSGHQAPSPRGFTMPEVMFAILIFGIGLIAVSSIFPVAGQLQKRAIEDTLGQQVADLAIAEIKARKIAMDPALLPETAKALDGAPENAEFEMASAGQSTRWLWNSPVQNRLRSFPDLPESELAYDKRSFYWIPVVRRSSVTANQRDPSPGAGRYQVHIMVVRRFSQGGVPELKYARKSSPPVGYGDRADRWVEAERGQLHVGEYVLGRDGRRFRVLTVARSSRDAATEKAELDRDLTSAGNFPEFSQGVIYAVNGETKQIGFLGDEAFRR